MKKGLKIFLVVLTFILVIGASYTLGYGAGRVGEFFRPAISWNVINTDKNKPKDLDFSFFWDVWNKIHQKYVGTIDDQKLLEGAISGMIRGLGDPYSDILMPEQSKQLLDELSQSFGGVGVELVVRDGKLTVLSPLDGSPAEKVGLKPKDVIIEIDGKSTNEMTFDEAVFAIRGEPGTKVNLTIMREGLEQIKEFEITREEIKHTNVLCSNKDNVGIIRVRNFGDDTTDLVRKCADDFKNNSNIKGVVLDLRNNPGGYFDSAVEVASVFIEDGVIVTEEKKGDKKKEYEAVGQATLGSTPLVVLINEGSASASEIVAGALQDYKKGSIIGKKSFGKGSVQELEDLPLGLSLKLTVAKWLTPLGRAINGQGIAPDIEVDLTDEDETNFRDPQLERAIEEINKK